MVTKVKASIVLRRLTPIHESYIREHQDGCHPGRVVSIRFLPSANYSKCITRRRATIVVFLELKGLFAPVGRTTLLSALGQSNLPELVNLIRGSNSRNSECTVSYQVHSKRHGCPISPLLSNFVIGQVIEVLGFQDVNAEPATEEKLCDGDYADDLLCLLESVEHARRAPGRLARAAAPFSMFCTFKVFRVCYSGDRN